MSAPRQGCTPACFNSTAKASSCRCACGGSNHGGAHQPAPRPEDVRTVGGQQLVPTAGAGDSRPASSTPPAPPGQPPGPPPTEPPAPPPSPKPDDADELCAQADRLDKEAEQAWQESDDAHRYDLDDERDQLRDQAIAKGNEARQLREQATRLRRPGAARRYGIARLNREPFLADASYARTVEERERTEEETARLAACETVDGGEFHNSVAGGWQVEKQMGREDGGGCGATMRVRFADSTVGYMKPAAQPETARQTIKTLRMSTTEAVTHEIAAGQVATAMGPEFARMVPPTVLVNDPEYGVGSVQAHRGDLSRDEAEQQGRVPSAADHERMELYDQVIGNVDRHGDNSRIDSSDGRLHMIDHGSAFSDDPEVATYRPLGQEGRAALERLAASPDGCGGAAKMIGPYRAAAMQARIKQILAQGEY